MATANQKNLIASNSKYAKSFTEGHLALPPAKKYALVTCMDARIDPVSAFGIPIGDAHIIRNAGGSAREAIRSIIISEQLLGTKEVFVIKHTGCGMLTFQNTDARSVVEKNLGKEAAADVESLDFLPFGDLDEAVKDDIEFLREQKTVPQDVEFSGWVYEVESGKVRQVV